MNTKPSLSVKLGVQLNIIIPSPAAFAESIAAQRASALPVCL